MPKLLSHSMDTPSERFIPSTHVKRLRPTSSTHPTTTSLKTEDKYDEGDDGGDGGDDDDDDDDNDSQLNNTINCPCGDNDEDSGFTIQCEHCLTWQHGECVAIAPNDVPQHYVCHNCQSHLPAGGQDQYGSSKPTAATASKRPGNTIFDKEHSRDIFCRSSSGSTGIKSSSLTSSKTVRLKHKGADKLHRSIGGSGKQKRRSSDDNDNDNTNSNCNYDDDDDESVTPYDYSSPSSINKRALSTPYNGTGTRTSRASTRFEQVYRNIIRNKLVKQTMKEAREQWQANAGGDPDDATVSVDASLLLPTIPKVSVRPLWKSLSHAGGTAQNDPSVRKGVFAEIHVPENRFLLEINGEILIKSAYKCDPASLYPLLHTPEDHLFFYPSLDLLIDSRHFGNDSRFVRRSCHPNAQIKCIALSHNDDDQTMHMGLFTLEDVDKGEEISIAWDWQRGTSLWKNYIRWQRQPAAAGTTTTTFEDHQVSTMLAGFEKEFGECACQDKNECFVEYLKDACQPSDNKTATTNHRKKPMGTPPRRRISDTSTQDPRPGKRRRSKDHSVQQQALQPKKKQPQQDQTQSQYNNTNNKPIKRRGSVVHSNPSRTISADTRNDLFFASLPTSRSTSPVHHGKQEHSMVTNVLVPMEDSTTVATDPTKIEKKSTPMNRLPCKKAWMKTYLARTIKTSQEQPQKTISVKKEAVAEDFWSDSGTDDHACRSIDPPQTDRNGTATIITTTVPVASTAGLMEDLVLDESVGDDSSTATLTFDHGSEDAHPPPPLDPYPVIASSTFTSNEVLEKDNFLPKTTPDILPLSTPAPKPVKVSLKQYQSMRKRSLSGRDD